MSSRRNLLAMLFAGWLGGIAGCTSGPETDTGTASTTEPGEASTATVTSRTQQGSEQSLPSRQPTDTFTATDGAEDDRFGDAIDVADSGGTVLVGAENDESPNGDATGSAYVFTDAGGTWREQRKLTPAADSDEESFGNAVALSADGETALIAAAGPGLDSEGSAYIFTRTDDTWTQQARLTGPADTPFAGVGASVTLAGDGTIAVVGTPEGTGPGRLPDPTGDAFVFRRDGETWHRQGHLKAADGDRFGEFGSAVAASRDGSVLLVGAEEDADPNGAADPDGTGAAYVFTAAGDSWSQQAKLTASDGDPEDHFGRSVALTGDGETALVGAPKDDEPNGPNEGSAYLFSRLRGGWRQAQKLSPPGGWSGTKFGDSVALDDSGSTAVIGSRSYSFTAYVFGREGGTWRPERSLTTDDVGRWSAPVPVTADGTMAIGSGVTTADETGRAHVFEL